MSTGANHRPLHSCGTGVKVPPLLGAIAIKLGITVWPAALFGPQGGADHWAAMALFWAMAAGIVRGVGFVPRRLAWRLLFSGAACLFGIGHAILRITLMRGTP